MSEHILKLLAAYAAGTAATALLVRLVWLMPIEHYLKHILGWILPVPVMLIVLVMLNYGPQSMPPPAGEALPGSSLGLARIFLFGTLSTFGYYALVPVVRFLYRRITGMQDDEQYDDTEE